LRKKIFCAPGKRKTATGHNYERAKAGTRNAKSNVKYLRRRTRVFIPGEIP